MTSTFGPTCGRAARVDLVQELEAGPDVRCVLAGNVQLAARPCADGHEDGVELAVLERERRMLDRRRP